VAPAGDLVTRKQRAAVCYGASGRVLLGEACEDLAGAPAWAGGPVDISDFVSAGDVGSLDQLGAWAALDWRVWAASSFMRDRTPQVIVSRNLKVLAINARAIDAITASKVLSISGGRILAIPDLLLAKLQHAVMTASARESVQLLGELGSGVLLAVDAPTGAPNEPVTLRLRDLSVGVAFDRADLCGIFGLTPREQTAIFGLLGGKSPPEVADNTGRSVLTVRTHLKRAYAKIGVRSHVQLFARLLPLLQLLPPRGDAGEGAP
jgi:DNA-binding CsgD family transcriptional regulator